MASAAAQTSSLCVEIFDATKSSRQRHPLGVSLTSYDVTVTSENPVRDSDEQDSGCYVTEDVVDGPLVGGMSNVELAGSGSSFVEKDKAEVDVSDGGAAAALKQGTPCYRHIVSHIDLSSPLNHFLELNDEIRFINDMPIGHWSNSSVWRQFLCQGSGQFSVIVKPGDRRRRRFFKLTITVSFCEGHVTIEAEKRKCCGADVGDDIDKNVHLFPDSWKLDRYHFMKGDGHYVIVLQDEQIRVETLQLDTKPCNIYEFYGKEMDASKHQYKFHAVAVLAFKSAENGFFFLCARNDKEVALQKLSSIHNDIIDDYLPSSTDSRFFYQTIFKDARSTVKDRFCVFESTELADHYLACDGKRLFVKKMKISDRADIHAGKFPNLNFRLQNAGRSEASA